MDKLRQLEKRIYDLETKSSLEKIILNSRYFCLSFSGFTTGVTDFTNNFDISILRNHKLLIKSIKLVPFASATTDEFYNAGSGDQFQVLENMELKRPINYFTSVGKISIRINNVDVPLFPNTTSNFQVLDLFVDNIYFNYNKNLQSIAVNIDGDLVDDIPADSTTHAKMKVLMEVYSYD